MRQAAAGDVQRGFSATARAMALAAVAMTLPVLADSAFAQTDSTHAGHAAHAGQAAPAPKTANDTTFAHLQERGRVAMGVDQYTSRHVFEALPDGGRIELQRIEDDAEGTETIRRHLQEIAAAFRTGDFSTPGFVHWREVPGVRAMAERRERITYAFRELPRGGEVRITSADSVAVKAIHEFLAFQNSDHRTGH